MNILITGASGFLGKNLLLGIPKTWKVYGLYRNNEIFHQFIEKNNLSNVLPIKCDLTMENELNGLFSRIANIDVCVYLAANTVVNDMVNDPLIDVEENIRSLVNFLKFFNGKRLIYLSSGAVYMGKKGIVSPNIDLYPTIPYAISKFTSELYINFFSRKKKFEYVILRFFGAYGPYEPSRKISTRLLKTILESKNEFTIYGDGKNFIDFMYVDDAVNGIIKVIKSDKSNLIVDFCSGTPLTINELVWKVQEFFNVKLSIKYEGISNEYITFYASSEIMDKLFGFQPTISLENGFKKLAAWLSQSEENFDENLLYS